MVFLIYKKSISLVLGNTLTKSSFKKQRPLWLTWPYLSLSLRQVSRHHEETLLVGMFPQFAFFHYPGLPGWRQHCPQCALPHR